MGILARVSNLIRENWKMFLINGKVVPKTSFKMACISILGGYSYSFRIRYSSFGMQCLLT